MAMTTKQVSQVKTFLLILLGIVTISPLFIMFISSLKDDRLTIMQDMGSLRAFWVDKPVLNNYYEILGPGSLQNFGIYFRNSIIILAFVVAGTILVSSMAGYTMLRGKLKIHKYLLALVIALYIIPSETILLPLMYQVTKMRMLDTFAAQILPFVASPIHIFLFYQFMKQIPLSIGEAASIEGATFWQIYWRFYLPMNGPAVVTVAILQGMDSWNQYLWPLLITQTERVRPISIAIASYSQVGTIYWDRLMAASVLMVLPVLVLFLFFQKFFIASIVSSAVKG